MNQTLLNIYIRIHNVNMVDIMKEYNLLFITQLNRFLFSVFSINRHNFHMTILDNLTDNI